MKIYKRLSVWLMVPVFVGVILSPISQEPFHIGCTVIFCVFSWFAIALLGWVSIQHLAALTKAVIRRRDLWLFSARIAWLMLDAVIAVWTILVIVIGNQLSLEAGMPSRLLWLASIIASPVVAYLLDRKFQFGAKVIKNI